MLYFTPSIHVRVWNTIILFVVVTSLLFHCYHHCSTSVTDSSLQYEAGFLLLLLFLFCFCLVGLGFWGVFFSETLCLHLAIFAVKMF